MFEQIFKQPSAWARYRNAPLAEERERFLKHLVNQGWSRKSLYTVAIELKAVAQELDLSHRSQLTQEDIISGRPPTDGPEAKSVEGGRRGCGLPDVSLRGRRKNGSPLWGDWFPFSLMTYRGKSSLLSIPPG